MAPSTRAKAANVTNADVQRRGRDLQQKFRIAGIPQYTRWFAEVDPVLRADTESLGRIRRMFNGEGTKKDLALLEKCELLTRTHLKSAA